MFHVRSSMSERLAVLNPMFIDDLESKPAVKLNDYLLAAKLGEGAHSKVYLAIDCRNSKKYAAKAIKLGGRLGSSPAQLEREIRTMRKLSHPNIVKLHEVLRRTDTSTAYLIMEYAEYGTLSGKVLSEDEIAAVLKQVIEGLQHLHAQGIVHQDLKPSNIMLFADGSVKIGDFGIGHSFQSAETVVGSPAYQAPEFFDENEDDIDPVKEDIWSLGVTLYETAFGRLPFVGETVYEIAMNVRRTELEFGDEVSDEFKDLLKHILCVDPEKRYSLEDIMKHPFMENAGDRVVLPGYQETRIKMKSSASAVQVCAEVCDGDLCFPGAEVRTRRASLSWPSEPVSLGMRRL